MSPMFQQIKIKCEKRRNLSGIREKRIHAVDFVENNLIYGVSDKILLSAETFEFN